MTTETLGCLRINCPEFCEREDFRRWLNEKALAGLATWHPAGDEPGGCSDVFLVYDHGECGDVADGSMPGDVWEEVCRLCDEAGLEYGVVWLANVE
jgi:hypothetical protein